MIRFTVTWNRRAERELAELWLSAADRPRISSASNHIDSVLRTDPQFEGHHVTGDFRYMVASPLLVIFEVREPDRLVEIVHVRREDI